MVQMMGVMSHSLRGSTHMWEYYHAGAYLTVGDMTALFPHFAHEVLGVLLRLI